MPVLAGLLTLATLGSTAFAAPSFSLPQAAAYFSSILCAPNAALAATRRVLDDAMDEDAVPTAQPIDEDDPEAGFWTVGPTEEEMLPQNEAQSISSGASSVPDGPIPDGMAPLLEAHYEQGAGAGYVSSGAATVRNSTDLPDSEVAAEMMQTLPFQVELNSAEPQVLIMHTHTTETYELEEKNWCDPAFSARSTDLSVNMAAVGAEMAAQLNAAGVNTLHDTTLHDYPSYNGSYAKSNATVRSYLERYPSIKVVLDDHRDAIQRDDGTRVKPVADIGGMKAAQVMIICGADVDGNLPNFKQNLRFASRWQDKMESMFPGLHGLCCSTTAITIRILRPAACSLRWAAMPILWKRPNTRPPGWSGPGCFVCRGLNAPVYKLFGHAKAPAHTHGAFLLVQSYSATSSKASSPAPQTGHGTGERRPQMSGRKSCISIFS